MRWGWSSPGLRPSSGRRWTREPWAWKVPPELLQPPPPPTIASFAVPWVNVDVHPADPSALPAGEAVVLFHEEGLRHVVDPIGHSVVTRHWFRNVTYIRTEGGLKVADVVINVGSSDRLSSLRARTFKRDGRVVEMARNEVVQEKARSHSGGSPIRRVIFALPDVAMGDTIEHAYEIEAIRSAGSVLARGCESWRSSASTRDPRPSRCGPRFVSPGWRHPWAIASSCRSPRAAASKPPTPSRSSVARRRARSAPRPREGARTAQRHLTDTESETEFDGCHSSERVMLTIGSQPRTPWRSVSVTAAGGASCR